MRKRPSLFFRRRSITEIDIQVWIWLQTILIMRTLVSSCRYYGTSHKLDRVRRKVSEMWRNVFTFVFMVNRLLTQRRKVEISAPFRVILVKCKFLNVKISTGVIGRKIKCCSKRNFSSFCLFFFSFQNSRHHSGSFPRRSFPRAATPTCDRAFGKRFCPKRLTAASKAFVK